MSGIITNQPASAPAPTELGPESDGLRMTPAKFDAITEVDRDYRYELIRGVVVVSPPPRAAHRGPNDLLGHLLYQYQEQYQETHPEGAALDQTLPENYVYVSADRRIADRVLWCGLGRRPNIIDDVPTIAVEFVSTAPRNRRRDYVEKRREYLEIGVQEYWIIDRFRRATTVVFAGGKERLVAEAELYETPLLPGFGLPLQRLFDAADGWGEQV